MKDVNSEKALYHQMKNAKTRRIQAAIRKEKERKKNILFTVGIALISVIIYVLLGKFGGLATKRGIYLIAIVCGWIWLFFGQFMAISCIWSKK